MLWRAEGTKQNKEQKTKKPSEMAVFACLIQVLALLKSDMIKYRNGKR